MAYIVTAKIGGKRIESKKFNNKSEAIIFADNTKKDRKGSNPRIKKVK